MEKNIVKVIVKMRRGFNKFVKLIDKLDNNEPTLFVYDEDGTKIAVR